MSTVSGGIKRGKGVLGVLNTDPETFGLTALLATFFGYFGYQMGRKFAGQDVDAKRLVQPERSDATMTQAVQTRAAPTNAPGDRRPDENLHKLSDELSKQADEGTLGKK